eukprot:jgi/Mesvir1/19121/Mv12863-RA.1
MVSKHSLFLQAILFSLVFVYAAEGASVEETVSNFIRVNKIAVFSKSYCPYCKRAKATFAKLNVTPAVMELDQLDNGGDIQQELHRRTGVRTVPQVFIDGKFIGGSDDTVRLEQEGKLRTMVDAVLDREL